MGTEAAAERETNYSLIEKSLAWSVHIFTMSGIVAGFMAILAINDSDWRMAMIWLIVCLIIDGIDGSFARVFRVKEILPNFDGKSVDYVIDFATYAIIPAYFFYMSNLVPEGLELIAAIIILLISAFYYGRSGMVSDDLYFVGFPVMWNMVVFYLFFVFSFDPMVNFALVIFLSIMHIVPIKYLYPSRTKKFQTLTILVTALGLFGSLALVFLYPERHFVLEFFSGFVLFYFGAMSIFRTYLSKGESDTEIV